MALWNIKQENPSILHPNPEPNAKILLASSSDGKNSQREYCNQLTNAEIIKTIQNLSNANYQTKQITNAMPCQSRIICCCIRKSGFAAWAHAKYYTCTCISGNQSTGIEGVFFSNFFYASNFLLCLHYFECTRQKWLSETTTEMGATGEVKFHFWLAFTLDCPKEFQAFVVLRIQKWMISFECLHLSAMFLILQKLLNCLMKMSFK